MSEEVFQECAEETDLPSNVTPGHHAMAQAAFSWGDQDA